MTAPTTTAADATLSFTAAQPSPKQQFLDAFRKEAATTLKVLRAYPAEQAEFRPHPTSNSARELAWTFVLEQLITEAVLEGRFTLPPNLPPLPATWAEVMAAYEAGVARLPTVIGDTPEQELFTTTQFRVGPKQLGEVPKLQVAWLMLCDSIHHRGQLSVYLRMVGGKVPSIYGPSRDEPWS